MSWTLKPYVGLAADVEQYEFEILNDEVQQEVNEREQEIIQGVIAGLKALVPGIGGFLSVSAYGQHAIVPSPGDTTAIYVTHVADPSASGGTPAAAETPADVAPMTTEQALVETGEDPARAGGIAPASGSEAPDGSGGVPGLEQPVAAPDPGAQPGSEPVPVETPAAPAEAPVAPSVPVDEPPAPVAPEQPPVATIPAGQEQSVEAGGPDDPNSAENRTAQNVAENPVTTPDGSPAAAQGAGVDPAPEQPGVPPVPPAITDKPYYLTSEAPEAVNGEIWVKANVQTPIGEALYTYVSDVPGGSATGDGLGGVWHAYNGPVVPIQPSAGTPIDTPPAA